MNELSYMRSVNIIVAVDESGGFGKAGKIPWIDEPVAKTDLKRFKQLTANGVCIMGRNTYEDIAKIRGNSDPILPNRKSYVVSKTIGDIVGATVVSDLREAVERETSFDGTENKKIFVIGGEKLFIEALPWTSHIYMTIVNGHYDCDRFFPFESLVKNFKIVSGNKEPDHYFVTYQRIR